ncbi:MAG: DUF2079 domain-containing protein [Chloroflexi bacterium]|nr:DUF2079 domain-containing protein [Chloroflexota bacterium]
MLADFLLLSGLALHRHDTFHSNAVDLGYHDQVIWNTLQGRPFRFSTYQQDERATFAVDVPLAIIRDPNSLLSYHVEPLLVLIAPLYWLWDDAHALLVTGLLVLLDSQGGYGHHRDRLGALCSLATSTASSGPGARWGVAPLPLPGDKCGDALLQWTGSSDLFISL